MTRRVLARRRAEREALLALVRNWAQVAGPLLGARAVVVVGSVARGDFNKWSDVDVLVVAPDLPDTLAERLALVATTRRPPGVEVILWTPAELERRRTRGNDPIANDLAGGGGAGGVVVYGDLRSELLGGGNHLVEDPLD